MSDLVVPSEGRLRRRSWRFRLPLSRSLLRILVSIRRRLRHQRLERQTQIPLCRLDERLLYDIGVEPLDLMENRRKSPKFPWINRPGSG